MLHRVRGGFPLNFGRETVCELINKPDKGDWKTCVVSDEQERYMLSNKCNRQLGRSSSNVESLCRLALFDFSMTSP